ncbi:flagellar hook-associated protein FlgK [Georgenia sp. SYP-B2076]|uniref:flagellar hook-associated protein FlgK n=1 Tax=Georgenia sp. SYP-B2076 TaxID=2495881 RepID=UPI000F8F81F0|nr:flagellar hook-associated protein FlgK [Georgenia sp. SYP-B2076]
MSTFSGLNGALTSLVAQRQALEIAGQNIANVNTPGYTRQRANLQSIEGSAAPSMNSTAGAGLNGGVNVTSFDRLGDIFLEARTRQETSSAAYLDAIAEAYSLLESGIAEPGEKGLSAQLDTFFTSWEDVGNRPDDPAARAVLLENASALVARIATGYRAVESQWEATRTQADALKTEVNTTADAVADLNGRIRTITVSGGSPNALIDQRNQLLTSLASLIGGEARAREDGTVDLMVGGNALVRGDKANHVEVEGASTLSALGTPPGATDPVVLTWKGSGNTVGATGGRLAGLLAVLAPSNGSGTGGPLAEMASKYNALVTNNGVPSTGLVDVVNAAHQGGYLPDGTTGGPFFTAPPYSGAAALSVKVEVPNITGVATVGKDAAGIGPLGPMDGSNAEKISRLAGGVGALWSRTVVDLGVQTRTATQRAASAESTRSVAEGLLLSQTGVNLDEETVNLMASQRAYEAAARVITTVDEMLDTLINRTGVVGR